MTTQTLNLGVAPILFIQKQPGIQVDFHIQNLSANNIEIGDSGNLVIGTGLRLVPNGVIEVTEWRNDVYLISAGANSDVRIMYQEYAIPIPYGAPPVNIPFPYKGGG